MFDIEQNLDFPMKTAMSKRKKLSFFNYNSLQIEKLLDMHFFLC